MIYKEDKLKAQKLKEVKAILKKDYGANCKDRDFGCIGCRARLCIDLLDEFIYNYLTDWDKLIKKVK